MEAVSISKLKNNPSEALRKARTDLVIVMNRNRPDAVIVGLSDAELLQGKGVRPALATALFRDGHLSLARAARLAEMPVAAFSAHLSRLGIPVIRLDEDETQQDMETLEEWLASS